MVPRRLQRRTDEQLIGLFGTDARAFTVFYDRNLPTVLAFCRRRVETPELAVDVTAETFARVLEHHRRFDPTRGSAAAWTLAIARNLLVDAARRRTVADDARRRLGMAAVDFDDHDLERVEDLATFGAQRARRALGHLGADQRDAIWARVVLEHDYDDIARELGCSPSVARQRVSRGLRTLKAQLEDAE